MQTTTVLLAALAGSAAANNWRAHPQLKRDMESLQARETGSASSDDSLLGGLDISEECQSAVLDVMVSLPTPNAKIASEEMKNPQTGDPCAFTVPPSLSKEYADYSSEIMSWYSQSESEIMNAYSACSDIADKATDFIAVCSTDLPMGAGGSKSSSEAKETGTESASDAKETGTESASDSKETATESSSGAEKTPSSDDEDSAAGRVAVGGLAVAAAVVALL